MKRFSQLKRVYKVLISLILAVALLVSIPFIVKAASDGEIDIYKLIYELIVRVDDHEEKIRELEKEIEELEDIIDQIQNPTPTSTPTPTPTPGIEAEYEQYVLDVYIVQPEDSLLDIAENFYSSNKLKYQYAIIGFNQNNYPEFSFENYEQGWILYLPSVEYIYSTMDGIIDIYIIQYGDFLAGIANKFYGSSSLKYQQAIIDANIDKYPNFTRSYYRANWVLSIPEVD